MDSISIGCYIIEYFGFINLLALALVNLCLIYGLKLYPRLSLKTFCNPDCSTYNSQKYASKYT